VSLSQPSAAAPAKPAFNWIEVCAIPVAANIMETQPIVLLLVFISAIFGGSASALPLGGAGITLLLVGLQWWAMFINARLRQGMSQNVATLLHIVGVACAFALALLVNIMILDVPLTILIAGVVILCWKRGIDKARNGLDDEQLIFVFKLGLGVLLVALALSVLALSGPLQEAASTLSYALPFFFFSGIIALSFTRVSIIRREHARQGIAQVDTTRGWLVALSVLWGIMVIGALALETFSFRILQALLLPLWYVLAVIVAWIIYAMLFVLLAIFQFLNALFHFQPATGKTLQAAPSNGNTHPNVPSSMQHFPDWVLLVGRLILVVLVVVVLIALFRVILRHIHPHREQDSEEEIRETLSMRSILRERRLERKSHAHLQEGVPLDVLAPDSVRARYRELLQQMAEHGERLGRRPEETPLEYQKRLLALMSSSAADRLKGDDVADREILADLTRAYIKERYGERAAELQVRALPTWVAHLAERLTKQ
jgi:hypothetical protein